MNERTKTLLADFLSEIPEKNRDFFQELAQHAILLGYTPKKTKTGRFCLDFSNRKVKKTILKLEGPEAKDPAGKPGIRIKFYASKTYSDVFDNSLKALVLAHDGRYTGCYGCGRCQGVLEGYTVALPDGKSVFRCGGELVPILGWEETHLSEIKQLIGAQHDFWEKNLL